MTRATLKYGTAFVTPIDGQAIAAIRQPQLDFIKIAGIHNVLVTGRENCCDFLLCIFYPIRGHRMRRKQPGNERALPSSFLSVNPFEKVHSRWDGGLVFVRPGQVQRIPTHSSQSRDQRLQPWRVFPGWS